METLGISERTAFMRTVCPRMPGRHPAEPDAQGDEQGDFSPLRGHGDLLAAGSMSVATSAGAAVRGVRRLPDRERLAPDRSTSRFTTCSAKRAACPTASRRTVERCRRCSRTSAGGIRADHRAQRVLFT